MNENHRNGNDSFSKGNFELAISYYSKVLLEDAKSIDCLLNRSLCYLRMSKGELALRDALNALEIDPKSTKALYRQACALESLSRMDEALSIARLLIKLNPLNVDFQNIISRLTTTLRKSYDEKTSTKIQLMTAFDALKNASDIDAICQSLLKILHFAQGSSGGKQIANDFSMELLAYLKNTDSQCQSITYRVFEAICNQSTVNSRRILLQLINCEELIVTIAQNGNKIVSDSACSLLDTSIYWATDLESKRKTKKPINVSYVFDQNVQKMIDQVFRNVVHWLDESTCFSHGRDNLLRFIIKYADREQSLAWSSRLISFGLPKVLRITASIEKLPRYLPIGVDTRMLATCTLGSIYDDLCSDPERDRFRENCEAFIKDLLVFCNDEDRLPFKIKAIQSLACILQGVFDVGNAIIGNQNIVPILIELANSESELQQIIALDTLLLSSSKTDKAVGLLAAGYTVLKKLFQSQNEEVKVRALVGLCKLVSCKGTDYSKKTVSDSKIERLAKTCFHFLDDCSMEKKKFAADALAFLTLDGNVKEDLVHNRIAIKNLFDLCKVTEADAHIEHERVAFAVASTLLNLTNAEPIKKPDEQMMKLAQYAKHHIPLEHPKDSEKFISERRSLLVKLGVASVLYFLAMQKSESCMVMVAKVFCALCQEVEHRGAIVAAGAAKTLCS